MSNLPEKIEVPQSAPPTVVRMRIMAINPPHYLYWVLNGYTKLWEDPKQTRIANIPSWTVIEIRPFAHEDVVVEGVCELILKGWQVLAMHNAEDVISAMGLKLVDLIGDATAT
jgi:hypothetical protein